MGQITIQSHQNGNPYVMCLPWEPKWYTTKIWTGWLDSTGLTID